MRADGRAYVLLDGASGVLALPVAAELPLALVVGRRVVVAGDDPATWLVVGLTGTSVLNVAHGLVQLDASGDVADGLLSANVALKNAANVFTLNQTIRTGSTSLLTIDGDAGNAGLVFDANAGVSRFFRFQTAGLIRWVYTVGGAETGANAGANFAIDRYNDAGAGIVSAMFIRRSDGQVGVNTNAPMAQLDVNGTGRISGNVGIGTAPGTARLTVAGSVAVAFATKTAAYTLTATDSVISADATGAAFTVTLPTAVGIAGRMYTIKRVSGGVNNVMVDGAGAETIDGALTSVLTAQWQTLRLVSDGAGWLTI